MGTCQTGWMTIGANRSIQSMQGISNAVCTEGRIRWTLHAIGIRAFNAYARIEEMRRRALLAWIDWKWAFNTTILWTNFARVVQHTEVGGTLNTNWIICWTFWTVRIGTYDTCLIGWDSKTYFALETFRIIVRTIFTICVVTEETWVIFNTVWGSARRTDDIVKGAGVAARLIAGPTWTCGSAT